MIRQIERRPLVVCCLALIVGLISIEVPWVLLLLVPLALPRMPLSVRVAATVAFLLGVALHPEPVQPLKERVWVHGEAEVISVAREAPDHATFEVRVNGLTLRVLAMPGAGLGLGDRIALSGVARPPTEAAEPIFLVEGIQGRLDIMNSVPFHVVRRGPLAWRVADDWRRSFDRFASGTLPDKEARLLQALAFRSPTLDPEETGGLRRTGTVHLVAASGVHVMALAALVTFLVARLPIPRLGQLGIVGVILVLYGAATGAHPPTVRAVLMCITFLTAYRFRREPDGLSSLALAAIVCLLWDPRSVFQLGFQLSMVVVAALILFPPVKLSSPRWIIRKANDMIHVSLVAAIAAEPIVAYTQHSISLTSIPANVMAVAAACGAIAVGLSAHVLSFLVPGLGQIAMTGVALPLLKWVHSVVVAFDNDFASYPMPAFGAFWVIAFYSFFLVRWRERVAEP